MNELYAILASILVSLISVIAAIPILLKKKLSDKFLLFLLSISIGALLSVVFVDFLPEIINHSASGFTLNIALYIISGFLVMLVIEKFIHHEHGYDCSKKHHKGHGHAYALAPLNLIGEAIHNFIDGLVIAGSFAVNIYMGITATISIIFHELPQEIADMGILLYSGLSKKDALKYNLLSALSCVLGVIVGIFFLVNIKGFEMFFIPFAAGTFLYIAASNLVPQLHRECSYKETFMHIFGIILGIIIIVSVSVYSPDHSHSFDSLEEHMDHDGHEDHADDEHEEHSDDEHEGYSDDEHEENT